MKFLSNLEKTIVLFLIALGNTFLVSSILMGVLRLISLGSVPLLSFILDLIILILILNFFWKRWAKSKIVILVGILIVCVAVIFSLLSPATLPFPGNVAAFQIFILFAPFILILPILGPITLVYAAFRGLLKNQTEMNMEVPTPPAISTEQTHKKQKRLFIALGIAGVIILIIAFPAYYVSHTGTKDVAAPNDPLVGQTVIFDTPLVYSRDCTGCGGSPKELEINRSIECMYEMDSLGSYLYKDKIKNITYIPTTMQFTVTEVFKPHHYGITSIDSGPGDYRMAVLKDSNGLLSTILANEVGSKKVCPNRKPSYLDKLFRYIESAGKARIELALYNVSTGKSDSSIQQEFINSLPKSYNFSQINKVDTTFIPELVGMDMSIDANALAYLVTSRLDLKIWELKGLDAGYQSTLTANDNPERGVPLNLKNQNQ